ncbi:MAG: GGDEF domain-containing protein [Sulfurimonas sp.]|uniref:GGDEF domain-containing protein n=1 Tax=Sulfurimonas sp. TaxID=2022749 RepID=UPI003D117463
MLSYFFFFAITAVALFYFFKFNSLKEHNKTLAKNNEALLAENRKFENLAMIDALTQIPNRRFLDELYTKRFEEHLRDKTSLGVFMIDIDYFKAYNDFYGHVEGDAVLVKIAQTLQKTLKRPSDFIVRYGGEEFVIVLKGTSLDGVLNIAKQLIDAVEKLKISHEKSKTLPYITISIGIAYKNAAAQVTQTELLAYADRALYKAKASGKNCYVLCEKTIY